MRRHLPIFLAWLALAFVATLAGARADEPPRGSAATSETRSEAEQTASALQIYAHSFEHRRASDASELVRPRLSPRGAVEVQPGTNTLVVRDVRSVIPEVRRIIESFDVPPGKLRFDVQMIRAGPAKSSGISPVPQTVAADPELTSRLRKLLRYEDYEVVAGAELSAREGDEVDYALGERFAVSFRLGGLIGGRRMQVRDFNVVERPSASTDKSRLPDPRSLFDAHLNLWLERPFTLVLTRDQERKEALLVVITVERDLATGGVE